MVREGRSIRQFASELSYGLNTLAGAFFIGHRTPDSAWRTLFMIGGTPILLVPLIIIYLAESPRFLLKAERSRPAGMRHQLRRCAGLANDATSCQSQQFVMLAIRGDAGGLRQGRSKEGSCAYRW
jgi:MFS family permease